ncbi:sulfatase [Zhouia spongiae]|uniref:Sulfatase n=1 Tax=Zhouia spongiae TaxID=2202721 RepID=A0ABY3YID9_9FLAO|nr:sulfatase [Zhouia spongiae]UNY97478.1 sulfatase [Zhouia spongiae]
MPLNKPNILFIAVDDLRPELGCYGNPLIRSPHIDALAKEGTLFKNHYTTVPTCGASRYALLSGKLPYSPEDISNHVFVKKNTYQPEKETPETFIHHLKRNGYHTVGIGKISHHPDGLVYNQAKGTDSISPELPYSWDEMIFNPGKWGNGQKAFFGYADGSNRNDLKKEVEPYEQADVSDEGYVDGLSANLASQKLKELRQNKKPFFLAVGFFKPHLPFNAPKKYWDLYDEDKIPLSNGSELPRGVHLSSLNNNGEFNQYKLGKEKPTLLKPASEQYARKLKHAYYASVSYVDAQVGKVLKTLKEEGLADNTIVILWGDHGWQLGDHRMWGKHTCFEKALHSPLIIRTPSNLSTKNATINRNVVSTVDIYPTIMDLTGLEMPYKTKGKSLKELLSVNHDGNRKDIAYSYFNKGISLRTEWYRLTRYQRQEKPAIELFDYKKDPYEMFNVAGEQKTLVDSLMPLLEDGNTGLYDVKIKN